MPSWRLLPDRADPSCHAKINLLALPAFAGVGPWHDLWSTAMRGWPRSQRSLAPPAALISRSVQLLHLVRLVLADCPAQRGTSARATLPLLQPCICSRLPLPDWTALQAET